MIHGNSIGHRSGRPAVFFDRDVVLNYANVVNSKPYAPKKFSDFIIYAAIRYKFHSPVAVIVILNKNETLFCATITKILSRYLLIGEYILYLFNALKSCFMSFKSGEYCGKNSN